MNPDSQIVSCCYGKIPTLGDFINRGMPNRMVELWDEWLQESMSASREQLGEDWLDCYLESPVWYFALGAGCIDQRTWLGVLIPSVDRVGRYFPFSILRPLGTTPPLVAMRTGRAWYSDAEQLALDSLSDEFSSADLEPRLGRLPDPPGEEIEEGASSNDLGGNGPGRVYLLGDAPSTNSVLTAIADDSLRQLHPGHCLWWSAGMARVPASLLISSGLPRSTSFASLLDGEYVRDGWAGFRKVADSQAPDPPGEPTEPADPDAW